MKDKANRITLRLNDKQFDFVRQSAEMVDVSPSEFLRMVINATMVATNIAKEKAKEAKGRENDKTNSSD